MEDDDDDDRDVDNLNPNDDVKLQEDDELMASPDEEADEDEVCSVPDAAQSSPVIYVTQTHTGYSSRPASAASLPLDYVQSTRVFQRNEYIYFVFVLAALFSLAVGVLSLLLVRGFWKSIALAGLQLAITLSALFMANRKRWWTRLAPLKFSIIVLLQTTCVMIIVLSASAEARSRWTFTLKLVFYGVPLVVYTAYLVMLLVRSLGVEALKPIVPHYYIYLNLV